MKDHYFLQQLEQHGVEPYEAAIALVETLRTQKVKTAVVSSSNNCAAVLEAAGISGLFDARVDGMDITRLALNGKAGARWVSGSGAASQGRPLAGRRRRRRSRRRRGGACRSIRVGHRN